KTTIHRLTMGVLALCSAVLVAFGVCSLNASAETTNYAYTLAFQDNFDGTLSDGWAVIKGGSSYSYETDTGIKYGWRFRGNDHIAYKTATATDYGKFLYGDLSFTDYVFEVKMRADVNETLGEFLTEYSANLGAGLSLNTHLPFFVTDSSPDAAKYTFIGRSVCVSNYAIGFYEYGGDNGNGWAKSVRLNTKFSGDFDWRQWHTVRVEASAAVCNVYLDDVLMVSAAQSDFTRATATSGFCGFAGVCSAAYSPLHFDDFRLWEKNAAYDPEEKEEKEITAMNAADFKDKTKTDYQSASVNTALTETEKNALIYNTDGAFGTDIRLLKDTTFQSFEITAAFGIENQKAAKGVVEGEALSSDVRTGIGGILFYGSDHNTADGTVLYSGYMLRYHAVYCSGGNVNNTILLEIRKYENNVTPQAAEAQIGVLRGTTSCIINAKAENGIISVSVYKTAEDLANGNKAALDSSSSSVTAENGVYSFALPDHNAETGGDYTEGQIGFWCNGGGTGTRYVYEAEILSFRGKATVPSDAPLYQPVEEEAEYTLNIAAATGGAVKVNGEEKTGKITAAAHSDVQLSFVPAEGYL
ncbi:MAG: hypothetical protein ACI4SH_06365, partial [Candidatus Scatosoma sp.]